MKKDRVKTRKAEKKGNKSKLKKAETKTAERTQRKFASTEISRRYRLMWGEFKGEKNADDWAGKTENKTEIGKVAKLSRLLRHAGSR